MSATLARPAHDVLADTSETSRPTIAMRPDPNFAETWALAATVPLFWIIAHAIPVLPLVLLFAPVGLLLARRDAARCGQVFGQRFANPLLAIPTPLLYLAVRLLRDQDLRAGRPLWTAIGLLPLVFFFTAMADVGAYAMRVHGW